MIVLDASALVELLLGTAQGREIGERIADPTLSIHVPHFADVEVAQVLRRYVRDGVIDSNWWGEDNAGTRRRRHLSSHYT